MSAFMVSDKTMEKVIHAMALVGPQIMTERFKGIKGGVRMRNALQKLGDDLFAMNQESLRQRYRDNDDAPKYTGKVRDFKIPQHDLEAITIYKQMQCLSYQCCEGSVPDSPLYKQLELCIDRFRQAYIGNKSPEAIYETAAYEQAPWCI